MNPKKIKKLIDKYQQEIFKYSSDNNVKLRQLEDLKTTLSINQNLLYDCVKKRAGKNEDINILINNNKKLWKENENLINQKNELDLRTTKLQALIEDTPSEIREKINNFNIVNNKMKNELIQKDNNIEKLKNELEKTRNNALFKTARTEIFITEPSKSNVEVNNELISTKKILNKVLQMHNIEKKKCNQLNSEIEELQEELKNSREIAIKKQNEYNNKLKEILSSYPENSLKNEKVIKFDLEKFNNLLDGDEEGNDDFEEEEEQESEDSSEENDVHKKPKAKQNELNILTEQYEKLKKQNEDYENKISNYKRIYKRIKTKINNLKQSPNNGERTQKKINGINRNNIEHKANEVNDNLNV